MTGFTLRTLEYKFVVYILVNLVRDGLAEAHLCFFKIIEAVHLYKFYVS